MPPRKLKAVPAPPERPAPPDLRDAVLDAVGKMPWLGPSDDALKALALRQAEEIEKAIDRANEYTNLMRQLASEEDFSSMKRLQKLEAMCDVTKTVGWLGPQLQGTLRDLGGTPGARRELTAAKEVGGRLAELRAAAAGEHNS
jgi:hypothetical protein